MLQIVFPCFEWLSQNTETAPYRADGSIASVPCRAVPARLGTESTAENRQPIALFSRRRDIRRVRGAGDPGSAATRPCIAFGLTVTRECP